MDAGTVFITGADRGVGLGLVKRFLELGWAVYAGQFMAGWEELGELGRSHPGTLHIVPLDVSSDESVREAAAAVAASAGRLDMLINNAGISGGVGDIADLGDVQKGAAIFNVNALGALRTVRSFLPLMEKAGGGKRLCFVSSEAGSVSVCHRTDGFVYPMSKTALNMGVKLLFKELHPRGYTFRLYHPGWVRSYMSGRKSTAGRVEPEETALAAATQFTQDRPHEDVLLLIDNENVTWPF